MGHSGSLIHSKSFAHRPRDVHDHNEVRLHRHALSGPILAEGCLKETWGKSENHGKMRKLELDVGKKTPPPHWFILNQNISIYQSISLSIYQSINQSIYLLTY